MDQKRMKIAIHETGHGVMTLFRGQGVEKISLKGMDSPDGTDKYLGFMRREPTLQKAKVTVNDTIREIMISLGGYASEMLFFNVCHPGGNDLTKAEKWSETLLQVDEYRNRMATLPVPEPGPLDQIQNPQIRAFVYDMIPECERALRPLGPLIKFLAEELYKKDELDGHEVEAHFNSFMQSRQGEDQLETV